MLTGAGILFFLIAILGVIIFSDIFTRKSNSHETNIYFSYLEFNNFSLIQNSVKVERNILASALKKDSNQVIY